MEKFNTQQLEAINIRNANILVSAGAGSGKTKVLTARVLSFLCDLNNPCSLDDLVIMTFTNAAANEMKSRIRDKILEYIRNKNNDENIRKKLEIELCKLPNANISTIHKFCKRLIDINSQLLGIDPCIKLAGDNETSLILRESINEAIDIKLNENSENFNNFSFSFPNIIDDESIIINFIHFLNAIPFYKLWLENQIKKIENYENNDLHMMYINNLKYLVREYYDDALYMLNLSNDNLNQGDFFENASIFLKIIVDIFDLILKDEINFDEVLSLIKSDDIKISLNKGKSGNAKEAKNEIKEYIKKVKEIFISDKFEDLFIYNYVQNNGYPKIKSDLLEFINLARLALEIYKTKKLDNHIMDTNDLEQYTLEILYGKEPKIDENNNYLPNERADELAAHFKQVFIDEYQDSNRIQECILYALSSERIGKTPNLFMVGDIKQSIYRFRQADPDIFKKKYENYNTENNKLIELSYNYRSYKTVIDFVNIIFSNLFSIDEKSDVNYNGNCKMLYKGEDENVKNTDDFIEYEKKLELMNLEPEVLLLNNGSDDEKVSNEDEYLYIANKIYELIDAGYEYKDIAILSRDLKNVSNDLVKVLNKYNIPCFADIKTGFITLPEIVTTMDFLRIIDNPMQDIPLISVLKSKIFKFGDDDLVSINTFTNDNNIDFYTKLKNFYLNNKGSDLFIKCNYFYDYFENLRSKARFYSVTELIKELYNTDNFYNIISFSKNTANKNANLDLLLTKASDYENSSFRGLFDFIKYIENIESKKMDEGIASILSEDDNIVRIKTIHGSKGLEYKVVILMNIDKNLNKKFSYDFVYDKDYGFACSYVSLNDKIKIDNTIEKNIIKELNDKKEYEEQKRLLYVALTRAKEKLILIGKGKNNNDNSIAKNYFNMIKNFVEIKNIEYSEISKIKDKLEDNIQIKENVLDNEKNQILNCINSSNINFFDDYKYKLETCTEPKTSVSTIKKEFNELVNYINENESETESEFKSVKYDTTDTSIDAAEKGISIHRFLEIIDYNNIDPYKINDVQYLNEFVKKELIRAMEPISSVVKNGLMSKKELEYVKVMDIVKFLNNDRTVNMIHASRNNKLFREKSFMKLLPYDSVHLNNNIDNKTIKPDIIVQGIIDLYYVYDNQITLVDYKTDKSLDENHYIDSYKTQLDIYKKVLESFYDIPVTSTLIYSLSLGKYIDLLL